MDDELTIALTTLRELRDAAKVYADLRVRQLRGGPMPSGMVGEATVAFEEALDNADAVLGVQPTA